MRDDTLVKDEEKRPAHGLKRNFASAVTQVFASLILGVLGIASFKLLNPEGMAFFRHMYFTPFTISVGPCTASHDYLRSLLFGQPASEGRKAEMRSLMVVNTIGSVLILGFVFGLIALSEHQAPVIEAATVLVAVLVFALRFVLLGRLEATSRYAQAVVMANASSLLPYLAVIVYWWAASPSLFFAGIMLLNAALAAIMVYYLRRYSPDVDWRGFITAKPLFRFSFRKYTYIAMMAIGTVLSYQGVEFLLYTVTRYPDAEIANYALAYTVAAMVRQLANTFLQPLQARRTATSVIRFRGYGLPLPAVAEIVIIAGLVVASLLTPVVFVYAFPKYGNAQSLIAPLLFGVLGTSTLQLYSVQFVAASRVGYLAWSHVCVSILSLGSVWLLNGVMTLWQMSLLLSAVLWLRGVVITPLYARGHGFQTSPSLWLIRAVGSLLLFGLALAS